jgi:glycosyltransferase involved in cell wall biosynthesis
MPVSGESPRIDQAQLRSTAGTSGRVTFIVPVKDQLPLTRALVQTVRATNPEVEVEWVVVDSGSTDGTLEYCAEIGAKMVPLHRRPFNYCAAVNAGAAVATGDLWLISNNDIEFRSPGDLGRLLRLFAEWPLLSVVSPGRPQGDAELEFGGYWLWGACWATRPEMFQKWGGLPEELSGYGFDEFYTVSQCWRRGDCEKMP